MDGEELKKSLDNSNDIAELLCGLTEKIERLQLDNKKLVATCAALERLKQEKEDFEKQLQSMRMNPLRYIMQDYSRKVYGIRKVRDVPPVGTCGKCKDGWIYYTSPQGLYVRERCQCSVERRRYSVKEYHLACIGEQYDHLILKYSDELYEDTTVLEQCDLYHGQPFKDVFMSLTYFEELDKCKEYIAWLNENRPLGPESWPIHVQEKPYDEE